MLVLRPADAEETTVSVETCNGKHVDPYRSDPSPVRTSPTCPQATDYAQAAKGAYIVAGSDENPDVILVASGSEVATLVAGAELAAQGWCQGAYRVRLRPKGCSVVKAPGYQEGITSVQVPKVFGLTAGLPVTSCKVW